MGDCGIQLYFILAIFERIGLSYKCDFYGKFRPIAHEAINPPMPISITPNQPKL